ncbi:unnamed protein product, partial [Sphenostylis stenocarpa]
LPMRQKVQGTLIDNKKKQHMDDDKHIRKSTRSRNVPSFLKDYNHNGASVIHNNDKE